MKDKVYLIGPMDIGSVPTNGVTMKNQLFYRRFKELFPVVKTIDTWKISRKPWLIIEIILSILLFKNYKFIISGGHASRHIFNLIYKLRLKRHVVFWVAGGNLPSAVRDGYYDSAVLNSLDAILVQGVSMCEQLESLGVINSLYVPNSKPIEFVPQIKPKNSSDKIKFVFLSRIHPDKGCDDIFESVRHLNEIGFSNRFEVSFYGPIFDEFKESFLKHISEFENVKYEGFLNLTDNKGYETLATYDVMLFPTYWAGEGFPGVVIDAYIAGLPIIASDWNLNKEVIKDNESGHIIKTKDVKALTDVMQKYIDGSINIDSMRQFCLTYAQNFEFRHVLSEKLMQSIGFE